MRVEWGTTVVAMTSSFFMLVLLRCVEERDKPGITLSGASSISQWPEPGTTTPFTFVATRRACSIKNVPEAFSPVRTSTGIASGVAASARSPCVLLEVAEVFKTGAHRSRLRIASA